MECYGQSIIVSGKEINSNLGAAVRYVEQDSPLLADYFLVKSANITNKLQLERIRELYFKILQRDMNSSKQLSKRAQLYRDVAALTGLTYAFVQSLENTAKKSMKIEDAEREMSKIIEQVGDAVAFCYYATLGDQDKKSVQARLYRNNDNYFIYDQAKDFLETKLQISDRQKKDEATQKFLLTFYADDVIKAYTYFAENGYGQDREWNEFTYNLKLSLYTRFPELVRKLKTTSEN
jgi:chorismate mutase